MADKNTKNMELRLEKLQTVIEIYGGLELLSSSEKKEYEHLWSYFMARQIEKGARV